MPSLSKSKQLLTRLLPLSIGIIIAASTPLMLTACGGSSSGTTRTDTDTDDTDTTPEETYKLIIHSQVSLKNATIKVIDVASQKEIASQTISDGSDFELEIKESNAKNNLLIAELSGNGSQSSYYDPTLNKQAPWGDAVLHTAFFMSSSDSATTINPFTEISYQRALVRAGNLDTNNLDSSLLTSSAVKDLTFALRETTVTFGVSPTTITPSIATQADLNKLLFDLTNVEEPPNSQIQYQNLFMSMGYYMLQKNENSSDPSPYLTFTKRAAADMRDGSLDGYTLAGNGVDGSNRLANPIIPNAKENTFPEIAANTVQNIQAYQKDTQADYAARLKNDGVLSFFASLPQTDPAGVKFFTNFDYTKGISSSSSATGTYGFGAGNYKRALGIEPITIQANTTAKVTDMSCNPNHTVTNNTDEEIAIYPDCETGLNADGTRTNSFNAVEPLIGTYSGSDGCSLTIDYKGKVTLTKGEQSTTNLIARKQADALIRLVPDSQQYVLNVSSSGTNPTQFIQLRIDHQKITSATSAEVHLDANNSQTYYPTSFTPLQEQFSCQFS